ncbi:MAG TPA: hypothetical protein VFZ66_13240 [Herpetosiphonaceae bacterium]
MRKLRSLLALLIVASLIVSFVPTSSFATASAPKTAPNKCKSKRGFCKDTTEQAVTTASAASTIFNDRLVIATDTEGWFVIGAFPDRTTGDATPSSWDLSYRWPDAGSTSHTTIRIDGSDHVYGLTGTQREAPTKVDARTNRSAWQIGDIEVTQTLQIGQNSHTGQKDAAIIAYTLRNTGSSAHDVGTRVMIDTEINQSDGFPFRVPGVGAITKETEFSGAAVPDTFLASASAIDSTYVTASTLKSGGATTPDRLVLANWSNLSSTPYDYTIDPAVSLTDDSAYALYWNPKPLGAGETRTYVTLYGLGQATINQTAPLALSVRGPAALGRTWSGYSPNPFDIVATVVNTGTTTVVGAQLALNLPPELQLAAGSATQTIGSLTAGQERQVVWQVRAPLRDTQTTPSYSVVASGTGVAAKTVTRSISLPDIDATRRGPFAVDSREYRYDTKTYTDILSDRPTEIWGRTYWPRDLSKGPYPLVVFLHGNHNTCGQYITAPDGTRVRVDNNSDYTTSGTCPASHVVTPNHEGYAYLGEQLASWGYIVVSINANRAVTGGSNGTSPSDAYGYDHGFIRARGRLVLKHLQLWHQWNTTGTADASFGTFKTGYTSFSGSLFKGKVDLGNVGLMGHSRGGQGVRSAYDQHRKSGSPWPAKIAPLAIKGIFEIAPTDFNSHMHAALAAPFEASGTAWTVLLPMCDGDVIDLQGVEPFDRVLLNTGETPPTLKGVYTVWGTNHNFYNTEWQISDSDGCVGRASGNTELFTQYPGSASQRQTGLAGLLAFFRANVGIDPAPAFNLNFNPLASPPPVVTGVTRIDRSLSISPNASISSVLESFDKSAGTNSAGVPNDSANITITHGTIASVVGTDGRTYNHHDPTQRVGSISWASAGGGNFFQTNWRAAGTGRDISDHVTLDFRIARQISALNASAPSNFSIRLAHADGTLSDPVLLSAYADLRGPVGGCSSAPACVEHPMLQMARIPLKDFANAKLTQVRGVRFTFDQSASGAIHVANMLFARQFEPTAFPRQFVTQGATPFSVESEAAATTRTPQPDVEIELTSPNGFPVRNAMPVLRIGEHEFIMSRYKDGSGRTLIFGLSAAEFAAVADGDPVTLLYGPYAGTQEWLFGRLDKRNLKLYEQLLPTQQSARDLLAALRTQATTPQEQAQLDAALQRLDRTLDPALWRDTTHLQPGGADRLFDEAQQAVASLQQVLQARGSIPAAVMRNYIRTRVLHVLRGLAVVAIDEAAASGRQTLDQARAALDRGDSAVLGSQFVSAVQHYRAAWQHASRATP